MDGLGQVKVEPSCIVCRAEQLACSRTLYISFPMVIYISFCGFLSNEFTLLVSSESSVVVFLSLDCVRTHRSNFQCLGCFANLGLVSCQIFCWGGSIILKKCVFMLGIVQNHHSYRERPLGRGRSSAPAGHNQLPRPRNGRVVAPLDVMSFSDNDSQELQSQPPALQLPVLGVNGLGKSGPTDFIPHSHTVGRGFSHVNGCASPTERLVFGSLGSFGLVGPASSEQGRQLDSGALEHTHGSRSVLPMTMPRLGPNLNRERYEVCKRFSYAFI